MNDQLTWEQEFNKAVSNLEGAVWDILEVYNMYGMGAYRDEVTAQVRNVAIRFHARVIGIPDVDIANQDDIMGMPVPEDAAYLPDD